MNNVTQPAINIDPEILELDNQIRPLLRYEADLVDIFRDDSGINVVLRTRDDDEIILKLNQE